MDQTGFNAGDANLRRYVGNNGANAVDLSGLEDKKHEFAGPDVTEWFFAEIKQFRARAHERNKPIKIGGAIELTGQAAAVDRLKWLYDIGNRFTDYKARYDRDPTEEGAQKWPYKEHFDQKGAGDFNANTITFAGKVLTLNQLGNIMYGIMAHELNLVSEARAYGQGVLKVRGLVGIETPWTSLGEGYRATAFELGVKYAEKVKWDASDESLMKGLVDRGFRAPYRDESGKLHDGTNVRSHIDDNINGYMLKQSTVKYSGPQTDFDKHKAYGVDASGNTKK